MVAAAETTPSSTELDELTDQLRRIDSAGRRLDKSNVRIWFQNRRREQRQLATSSSSSSSSSLSAAAAAPSSSSSSLISSSSASLAASRLANDVSRGHQWPVSVVGHVQWPTRDDVVEAVTRLARYCIPPSDITNTIFSYSLSHVDC